MHPENVACLTAARLDVCALANNHVIDFDERGLIQTLDVLRGAGIQPAGAGHNVEEAQRPATVPLRTAGRLIVFSFGTGDSGAPWTWQATESRPGIDFVADLSDAGASQVIERVTRARQPGDIVMASIHWGSNWGYEVPAEHIRFAHRLVEGGVDVIHGHSSHHPRPIEVWNRKLVLYGCGDFINDYEGISGYEAFRGDLVLMYFAKLDAASGDLLDLEMVRCRSARCGSSARRRKTRAGWPSASRALASRSAQRFRRRRKGRFSSSPTPPTL
jgi:poly-gamma-glutamate synthesis protein (capsule biosynthesis protein)